MSNTKANPAAQLRRGWTTGACATAATKAAYQAALTGEFPELIEILLPKGERPRFVLSLKELVPGGARVGIVKDAGDDPDVTHGATIIATVVVGGDGVRFKAGKGVGVVTKPGLPVPPGEPAINPAPRRMMTEVIAELAAAHGVEPNVEVEISIPNGEELAARTWNVRLGIVGGLSILGTTGIVHPFSCSAWIHSIHRGIDVARAIGLLHVAGATGSTSEAAVQKLYGLPIEALLDMGDFAGGMLKYLRVHPVPRVTVAGGFGKIAKLAQGSLDLHSSRSQVDFAWLASLLPDAARQQARHANTAQEVLELARAAGVDIVPEVARAALATVRTTLRGASIEADVVVVNREGAILGRA